MLFIDPITKLNLKTGQNNELTKRSRSQHKLIHDEVDISSDAHSVKEIVLTASQAHDLQPDDSLIANLLSAVFHKCENSHTPITPLHLIKQQNALEIILQTPPIPQTIEQNEIPSPSESDSKQKEFVANIPVISNTGHSRDFTLYIELGLGSPKIASLFEGASKKIDTLPVKTPYEMEYLASLPQSLTFIVDQDGETDQIEKIIGNKPKQTKLYKNADCLRVWLINPKLVTPVILGDKHLGYVYVGNITPNRKNSQTFDTTLSRSSIDTEA